MDIVALSKALDEMTVERDAAIVAKEDLNAQLRVTRRRLKDAEEEQYKAEEDAATLREEVQALRHLEQGHNYTSSFMPDQQEIASMKMELEETWERLQKQQLKLAMEQQRNSLLTSKLKELEISKQEAESALTAIRNKQPDQDGASSSSIMLPLSATLSLDDNGTSMDAWIAPAFEKLKSEKLKHEIQLHELASMLERMEKGRQKLLGEIDAQSLEIERLFVENANLASSVKETTEMASQWENQIQQCLEHNKQLRVELSRLRMEQAMSSASEQIISSEKLLGKGGQVHSDDGAEGASFAALMKENSSLKVELATVKAQAEEQSAEVSQLSANLNQALLASNTLGRIYRPVLSNIENRLIQLKQDVSISNRSLL